MRTPQGLRRLARGCWSRIANKIDHLRRRNIEACKKAVVLGAIGSGALLFMRKRYPAGVLVTGVGLAVLAAEYPEKFEKVRQSLPEYFEHGLRVMEMAGQAGKRISQAAAQGAAESWERMGG